MCSSGEWICANRQYRLRERQACDAVLVEFMGHLAKVALFDSPDRRP
jgi:hypothetical protein